MAQIIPSDRSYTDTTPNWTNWPNLYMPLQVLTGAEAASGYVLDLVNTGTSHIHDGYRVTGGTTFRNEPKSSCAITDETAVTTAGDLGAFVYRPLFTSATVKVTGVFSVRVVQNGPVPSTTGAGKRAWWLAARVQDGVQSGTRISRPSGYYFGISAENGPLDPPPNNGVRFQLFRANDTGGSTTFTKLAEVNPSSLSAFQPTNPYVMRLEVTTNGATVELRCYAENIPKTAGVPGTLVLAISHDDTSASRLTAAGRCGFLMNRELQEGGTFTITALDSFKIEEGGTVVLQDEFVRTNMRNTRAALDAFGVSGRDLACDNDGDQFGDLLQIIQRTTSGTWTDRCQIIGGGVGSTSDPTKSGWFLFQRPPDSTKTMHRSCKIVFSNVGANPSDYRECGIVLKWSGGLGANIPTSCYYASIRLTPSTSQIRIDRVAVDPQQSVPVMKNIALLTAAGINEEQEYLFDFEVFNIDNSTGNPDGTAVCKVLLDSVQVVFGAGAVTANITITAAGDVLDSSSERVEEGTGEGWRAYNSNGSKALFFDAWQQEALTGTVGVPPQDQAGIPLLAENHNYTSQVLTVPLSWPAELVPAYPGISHEFEDGYRQTRAEFEDEREVWRVQAQGVTTADREALKTFWDTHDGTVKSFDWTTPANETYKFHFATDQLGTVLMNPGINRFSFELERVLD